MPQRLAADGVDSVEPQRIRQPRKAPRRERTARIQWATPSDPADAITCHSAALLDGQDLPVGRIRELFEALYGDGFDAVWAGGTREPAEVLWPLFNAINRHFNATERTTAPPDSAPCPMP
ncbi:hypothetical protein [Nocardia xishanensis]|uniref:Uncharacterized protein n=1 Tax=Nocardia xishanensis TaxID=238964 RepID=A0ABW7XBM4_9NOCA